MDGTNNTNIEQQPTTQPADNGTQGSERMFTQSEVDKIVKERLARAKTAPKEPTEAEIRERELTARESRLSCREYLIDRGYPVELLDVIDTSDLDKFKNKADTVSGLLNTKGQSREAAAPELLEMKRRIGLELGIPAELAARLTGENEKDIYKDADVMKGIIRAIKGAAPLADHDISHGSPSGFRNAKHTPRQSWSYD